MKSCPKGKFTIRKVKAGKRESGKELHCDWLHREFCSPACLKETFQLKGNIADQQAICCGGDQTKKHTKRGAHESTEGYSGISVKMFKCAIATCLISIAYSIFQKFYLTKMQTLEGFFHHF